MILITNLNSVKVKDLKNDVVNIFQYKELLFTIDIDTKCNNSFSTYMFNAFNADTGKQLSVQYPTNSLIEIKEFIMWYNDIATKHNKSQLAQLIKLANKKITNNKYSVKNGLYKGEEFISSDMENSIYILEQVISGEIILTSHELWMVQAPSFNFELDGNQLLEKALTKNFVNQVLNTNLFKMNKDY